LRAPVLNFSLPMTLGVYIQIPFCQTKCTYCNFHTGVVSRERYQPYAEAVCFSLGGQSFDDRELQAAGRMHRRADIFRAIELLRAAGVGNISIDLIAGLPHQTGESWEASVSEVLKIRPEHVSIYMLEIDEDSRLGKESLAGGNRYSAAAIPDDDSIADFYESARQRLAEAGYEHYEISNWALPGKRSRHNLKYWKREPYAGFGAGAHAFDGISRWANAHEPDRYVTCMQQGSSPREQSETLLPIQVLDEEMFLGLRMLEGIDFARIERELQAEVPRRMDTLRERIANLCSLGFLEVVNGWVRMVPDRLTVSNEVFVQLLS
jgi:oxygen-independent coproporphyrinogen III oxidase